MQMSKDGTMFITASKDYAAKLFDTDSLVCLKTYKTERPVNSAAVSPIFDHVSQFFFLMWIHVMKQINDEPSISPFMTRIIVTFVPTIYHLFDPTSLLLHIV
jgi:hypothetical protein